MPTFILEQGLNVALPNQPITVRAVTVPRGGQLRVRAVDEEGAPIDPPRARMPEPGLLILPRVDGRVRLRVSRSDGAAFPTGTSVSMSIAVERANDPDPRVARLTTEVSGLQVSDVAALVPSGQDVAVSLLQEASERPLLGLAGEAAGAARALVGAHRVPQSEGCDMAVLVDASGSMSPWVADGSLGAVLSVLAGVDHVSGRSAGLDVRLADASSSWQSVEPGTVGEIVAGQLAALPPQSGLRTRPYEPAPGQAWVVISDAVPLDVRADTIVVVLAREGAADQVVRHRRERDIVLAVPDGRSAADLFADPSSLQPVVAACLSALGVQPSRRNS